MKKATSLRICERVLACAGVLLLTAAGLNLLRYQIFETVSAQGGGTRLISAPLRVLDPGAGQLHLTGRLEVPRLGLSVAIVEGDEDRALDLAAVHLAGTPAPGAPGNSVIAGHRDTAFWPLRNLRVGDLIRVRTDRAHLYRVKLIRIVSPDDVAVLQSGKKAVLTLVTCYPFRHVGSAPKRFVVRADLQG